MIVIETIRPSGVDGCSDNLSENIQEVACGFGAFRRCFEQFTSTVIAVFF